MEKENKETVKKMVRFAVYEGLPLAAGVGLGAILAPLDGGYTLGGVAKFSLITLIGYGGAKSAIAPDQFVTFEAAAQRLANRICEMQQKQQAEPAEPAEKPVVATA